MEDKKCINTKKVFIFVGMCIALLLIYRVINIYALFTSQAKGNVILKDGVWNIIVNGTEISKGFETSFEIGKIVTQIDEHVKSGNLAPGLSGSFEISINPKDTDVSVRYDITLKNSELKNTNLNILSIEEVQAGNTLVRTGENTYTGIIPLKDIEKGILNKIIMKVEWEDDGLHDEEDTILGESDSGSLKIPISVRVTQYLGEDVIPYAEN